MRTIEFKIYIKISWPDSLSAKSFNLSNFYQHWGFQTRTCKFAN